MLRTATVCFAFSALPAVAAPSVVTDIAPVQALVARVMEGVADAPTALVPPGANPHALALKPSQAQALQDADVVFWIGEELSPWLEEPLETLAGDAQHIALLDAEATVKLEPREGLGAHDHGDEDEHGDEHGEDDHDDHDHGDEHAEDDHKDHDHGDEHAEDDHKDHDHGDEHAEDDHKDHDHGDEHAEEGHDDHDHGEEHAEKDHDDHAGHDHHDHDGLDPHAWLSPANGAIWLGLIADTLAAADPDNADTYRANAEAGAAEIETAVAGMTEQLAGLADVPFGVTHDAFQYFEATFDLAPVAAITGIDAIAAGPARVAAVQDKMQDAGVSCLFEEAAEAEPLSAIVIEGTGAKIIALDQFGDGTSYVAMLEGLAASYASCIE